MSPPATTSTQPAPTAKQRERLAQLEESTARIIGYSQTWRGPIVRFDTGARFIVTRDGGLLKYD